MPRTVRKAPPAGIRTVRQQFDEWRASKRPGERIPQRLWRAAARLCPSYGICRVAEVLRLNPASLRCHADRGSSTHRRPPAPTFVEGSLPPGILLGTPAAEYALELDSAGSPALRIRVRGATVAEVAALAQALWPNPGRSS